ncbi:hypothetical protein [Saccharothrix coeruleofusca]|uniref:Uncharacterized protein n=1 Tax=Saccharothrix coeruleofusca TaxID=33919 RepID=A0A918EEQ2_9PSEU|nr:hypothetical protein [Saccharothrix coeruleofusca]MBP2336262.1 hypothetical protein [Saccharothrix coeruleofusca]GGP54272.1 hypothetical protein GCM10010185_28430 [Saccharothrix coeruleofusca]
MIDVSPLPHPDELGSRAETMARLLRDVPVPFTRVVSLWVGYRVRREPRCPDRVHHLTARQAQLMGGLPTGTPVTRREGYLVPYLGGGGPRLAAITALLHTSSLELDEPQHSELSRGYLPLGLLLNDARRVTHYACPVAAGAADPDLDDPLPDEPGDVGVLRCQATLLSAGRPVALVRETVYEVTLTSRRPPDVLSHLHPPAHGLVS